AHMNPSYGGTQQIDYGIALLGAISALYSRNTWQYLGEAIAGAKNGEGAYFLALADSYAGIGPNGEFSNELAANAAINCVDNPYRSSISGIEALSKAMAAVSPNFGPAEAWGDLVCDFWPVVSRRRPGPAHLVRALPILVVGSTHDPATPYSWAKALSSQLAGSVLLTRTGDGHTGYLASQCVRKWVNGFFATGGLPSRGTVCAS
ncbi:MAG: alpha/beta hydrolase, partial [Acidimicrobiales bacterium]